jgi:drug/metabolite transporter (DMT)-like permease
VNIGVVAALGAAFLFGAGTPLAKWLLTDTTPWMLAGLCYLGSGSGLMIYRRIISAAPVRLPRADFGWLAGATLSGGAIAPLLLMTGLAGMPAGPASLLLNAEGVLTALLAWAVFREHMGRRVALGMVAIALGAVLLSWPDEIQVLDLWPVLAILGSCLAWAVDNNLTRKISANDASWITAIKGLVAGSVNLLLAFSLGNQLPALPALAGAMGMGFLSYGVSLALYVVGLRHLGTARTGAYFSIAPFVGATLAVMSGETITWQLVAAGILMGAGVWLHLTERHHHEHSHETMSHDHEHIHDEHHQHDHPDQPDLVMTADLRHSHAHRHEALVHSHEHYPDTHHRHGH